MSRPHAVGTLTQRATHTCRRDLCDEREEYRLEFSQVGVVQPLVGLLEGQRKSTTQNAAEALGALAQSAEVREAIRCAGLVVVCVCSCGRR